MKRACTFWGGSMVDIHKIIGLFIILLIGCKPDARNSLAPYASLTKLGEPIIFASGKVKTSNGICFSHYGSLLYTSGEIDKKFDNGKSYTGIFGYQFKEGHWSGPQKNPLGLEIDAYHPVLSSDNETLFFNSRSHPDSASRSIPHNIWSIHKVQTGWSQPEMVKGINSPAYDSYPSVAQNQNLYFNSDREGGKGGMDIYVSYFVNGEYQKPVNLEPLNSAEVENDLVVDPEERFIIFNRYTNATKEIDLFISFNKTEGWTIPRNLDNINHGDEWELTPTLSPDGRYFFYELENKLMQIELKAIIYTDELEGIGERTRI